MLYGNVAGRYVGNHSGYEKGRDPLSGGVFYHLGGFTVLHVEAADT